MKALKAPFTFVILQLSGYCLTERCVPIHAELFCLYLHYERILSVNSIQNFAECGYALISAEKSKLPGFLECEFPHSLVNSAGSFIVVVVNQYTT